MQSLIAIQKEISVGKNRRNQFGGFRYRSCSDILASLKPFLEQYEAYVLMNDEPIVVEGWRYMKTTVTFYCPDGTATAQGWAREAETAKGKDPAQITGSAASYAAKRALGNLFLVDDTDDPDANDQSHQAPQRINEDMVQQIDKKLNSLGWSSRYLMNLLNEHWGTSYEKLQDIEQSRVNGIIQRLDKKLKETK